MVDLAQGVVAVTAHPDDEVVTAGLYRRLNNNGIPTTLMCLTCGGRIRNSDRVSSDEVKEVRATELRASCEIIGGTELVMADAVDGHSAEWDRERIVSKISETLRDQNPAVVITFDRRIAATHLDHMATHELTTEAFHRLVAKDGNAISLLNLVYSCGFSKQSILAIASKFHSSDAKTQRVYKMASLLPEDDDVVVLELDDDELRTKLEVVACHRSQFPDENGLYYGLPFDAFRFLARYETYNVAQLPTMEQSNPFAAIC